MSVFWLILIIISSLALGFYIGIRVFALIIILCSDKRFSQLYKTACRERIKFRFGISDEELDERLQETEENSKKKTLKKK